MKETTTLFAAYLMSIIWGGHHFLASGLPGAIPAAGMFLVGVTTFTVAIFNGFVRSKLARCELRLRG